VCVCVCVCVCVHVCVRVRVCVCEWVGGWVGVTAHTCNMCLSGYLAVVCCVCVCVCVCVYVFVCITVREVPSIAIKPLGTMYLINSFGVLT